MLSVRARAAANTSFKVDMTQLRIKPSWEDKTNNEADSWRKVLSQ